MTFLPKNFLLIVTLVLASCGEEKKDSPKEKLEIEENKQKQLDSANLMEVKKISMLSNAIVGWDTTVNFTYFLQESLESNQRPISFIGYIKDVIKKDSLYILKVINTNSIKNIIAEISVSANTFQTIKLKLNSSEWSSGCFIFHVVKVSSYFPMLKSEIDSYGQNDEDATSKLTYDFSESLIKLQGKLDTCFFYDHLKE